MNQNLSGSGLGMLAGGFLALAIAAIWQSIKSAGWRDFRRCLIMFAVSIPLTVASVGFLILALKFPYVNFWNNSGLGSEWECGAVPASAQVCLKDVPPRFQEPAAGQPSK